MPSSDERRVIMKTKLWLWVANKLPKSLVYFCGIRIAAHGTSGKYSNQVVPDLTIMDAIKRWDSFGKD